MDIDKPDLIFLNEVQTFKFEMDRVMEVLGKDYCCEYNTEDKYDAEICLTKNKAKGGTMIIWKQSWQQYITILESETPSFLPILFHPPDSPESIHVSLYLPTSGKEPEFIEELNKLSKFLEETSEKHPNAKIYLRGDSNVNENHTMRIKMLDNFLSIQNLVRIPVGHLTYHHFLGHGLYDSNIDVIIHTNDSLDKEEVRKIYCREEYPIIDSHHDIIISSFIQPVQVQVPHPVHEAAPSIDNTRVKVVWSSGAVEKYQAILSPSLQGLRERWLNPKSKSSVALLLQLTNEILNSAAASTNRIIALSKPRKVKPGKVPNSIKKSNTKLMKKIKSIKTLLSKDNITKEAAKIEIKVAKSKHRNLIRSVDHSKARARDENIFSILSSKPSSIFSMIRAGRATNTEPIYSLKVGTKEYFGENVKDGFYTSIKGLKTKSDQSEITEIEWAGINIEEDYRNILSICKNKRDLPNISLNDSTRLLKKMKASVSDFYSITTLHYINAGRVGLEHFNLLLNCLIDDLNNSSIEELNNIYALLLHKGHGKPKNIDKSYRTISSCPLISKALDMYVRELHCHKWNLVQAPTQYLGEGSSHDLAALLVTEVIQYSIYTKKEPIYLLFLDARSAFDVAVPSLLLRNMYLAGMDGNTITYLHHRLHRRCTYLDWNKQIMGPILDEFGLEQGGPNSGDFYKLYNNDLLKTTQKSEQGIKLDSDLCISSVGLADDTVLVANSLSCLDNILYLAIDYCKKYKVTLSPEKTKLIRLKPETLSKYDMEMFNPITISGESIEFTDIAEHVGIVRSVNGNIPHIMGRLSAHSKALNAILFTGIARKYRANPRVGLRIQQIYATPVLLSGLGSLVLAESEMNVIENHFKRSCENLQKLLPKTPRCVVYFLGGILPARALLHLKQLSIFGMISRLPSDPLNTHARKILSQAKPSCRSWFWQIRNISLLYDLPHPLCVLENPPSREYFKKLTKSRVIDHWEQKLRAEAYPLLSLKSFNPSFMSLQQPHPIWSTAGSKSYEVSKAIQQARLLSGRYRTQSLLSHWGSDSNGHCLAPGCVNNIETVKHMMIECVGYDLVRKNLEQLWRSSGDTNINSLVCDALTWGDDYLLQFILDCSVLPAVIKTVQMYSTKVLEKLFYLTRTWCFSIHRERMKNLGKWNYQ